MIALYLRVSTDQQDTANQLAQLSTKYANGLVVAEQVSGIKTRPKLDELCKTLTSGDVLAVVALDRLGRSVIDVVSRVRELIAKGVEIHSLREGRLNNTPAGQFQITILAAVAEFERSLIIERTRAGVAKARSEGRVAGPAPSGPKDQVLELHRLGRKQRQIASELGCSLGYVNKCIMRAK